MPDEDKNPEDEFQDMIREILSGNSGVDPSKLAGAAGLPNDPASLQAMMMQFQRAMQQSSDGEINWNVSTEQAVEIGRKDAVSITPAERSQLDQAFHVAELWLAEVTSFASLTSSPRALSRAEWSKATMPLWTQLAEPVATNISNALTTVLKEQAPEQLQDMIGQATRMIKSIGGTMFAMQLGQVVGQLSTEVVSGGDVGIPLLNDEAALIPQNVAAFGEGLDIPDDQVQLYLAVGGLAHARRGRPPPWLGRNGNSFWVWSSFFFFIFYTSPGRGARPPTLDSSATRGGCDCTSSPRSPPSRRAFASIPMRLRNSRQGLIRRTLKNYVKR